MSEQTTATAVPFKAKAAQAQATRLRKAIERVWTTADADTDAWASEPQIFDFSEGLRLVLTVERADAMGGEPGALTLHVAAEAYPGKHPPLEPRHLLTVLWLFQRFAVDMQQKPLHSYSSGGRVHLIFAAPPGAGEPMPPEPEPPAPETLSGDSHGWRAPVTSLNDEIDVTIPPGLARRLAEKRENE